METNINVDSVESFIKEVNKVRRKNKGKWYTIRGTIGSNNIAIKGIDTWIQIIRVNGLSDTSAMDQSVSEFNNFLKNNLSWV